MRLSSTRLVARRPRLPLLLALAALALLLAAPRAARADQAPSWRDVGPEVRTLFRVAACGGTGAVPGGYDVATVDAHCKVLRAAMDKWRGGWLVKAQPFFATLFTGTNVPSVVVYPFGGGDLLTMLGVYPSATEYTTLSLEGMGDVRPLASLMGNDKKAQQQLAKRLGVARGVVTAWLKMAWNTTIQLSKDSNAVGNDVLPVVLVQTLVALELHGYEPVNARYFRVEADGTLSYLGDADFAAGDAAEAKLAGDRRRKAANENVLQVGAFTNIEIMFRKQGEPTAPLKTFRHFAADLSDSGLAKTPGPLKYLEARAGGTGRIAAMTKAASYLLWIKPFSTIRNYLLARMTVMVSDDTGIPPRYAKPAGFTQVTYGSYAGAYFGFGNADVQRELVKLWKDGEKRPLPIRFGYPDNQRRANLLFTSRP